MKILIVAILSALYTAGADEIIYQTSFEPPAFTSGLPLRGQDNWEMYSEGEAISIVTTNANTGTQSLKFDGSLLEQSGPNSVTAYGFSRALLHPVKLTPAIVEIRASVRLDGPQTGTLGTPEQDILSANLMAVVPQDNNPDAGELLAGFFVSSAGKIWSYSRETEDKYKYSVPYTFGTYRNLALRLDFIARKITWLVDDIELGSGPFVSTLAAESLVSAYLFLNGPLEPIDTPVLKYNPANYTAYFDDYSLVSISPLPVNAVIEFAATNILTDEFLSTVKLNVVRRGFTNGPVRVTVSTTNLTATAGEDYEAISTFITFAAGETNKSVEIPIHDDYWAESDKTFSARLSDLPPGATSGKRSVHITIRDDERPGSIDSDWSTTFGLPPLKPGERKLLVPTVIPVPMQTDGKPIVTFELDTFVNGLQQPQYFRVVRLNLDGSLDATFRAYQSTRALFATPLLSGEILISEDNYPRGQRLLIRNSDGTAKATVTSVTNHFATVKGLSDGKILLYGEAIAGAGQTPRNVVRLNSDYSLDTTFTAPASPRETFLASAFPLKDGKVLLGAEVRRTGPGIVNNVRILNSNGTVDTNFTPRFAGQFTVQINTTIEQPDGKLLLAGSFQIVNGELRNSIVRLNPNGSTDQTFATGTGFTLKDFSGTRIAGNISLEPLPGGNMLVSGDFDQFNGSPAIGPILLRHDGSRDPAFEGPTLPKSEYLGLNSAFLVGMLAGWPIYFTDYGIGRLRAQLPLRIVSSDYGPSGTNHLTANALSGRSYTLQSSEAFSTWSEVTTQKATTNRIEFADVDASRPPQRFYRVRQE